MSCSTVTAWPEYRLGVELDSRTHHSGAQSFEADRAKDRALAVAGWRVIRLTWRQLRHDGPSILADLATLLAH